MPLSASVPVCHLEVHVLLCCVRLAGWNFQKSVKVPEKAALLLRTYRCSTELAKLRARTEEVLPFLMDPSVSATFSSFLQDCRAENQDVDVLLSSFGADNERPPDIAAAAKILSGCSDVARLTLTCPPRSRYPCLCMGREYAGWIFGVYGGAEEVPVCHLRYSVAASFGWFLGGLGAPKLPESFCGGALRT